jgi:hypothetical protein
MFCRSSASKQKQKLEWVESWANLWYIQEAVSKERGNISFCRLLFMNKLLCKFSSCHNKRSNNFFCHTTTVMSCIDASVQIVTKSPKVGPLLTFSISLIYSQNWDPPTPLPLPPLPLASVPLPPEPKGGGAHSPAGWGGGGVPIPTRKSLALWICVHGPFLMAV